MNDINSTIRISYNIKTVTIILMQLAEKYGNSIIHEFESIMSKDRKQKISINIPIISPSNNKVNYLTLSYLNNLGIKLPYNDVYFLYIESIEKFYDDFKYFERILKLKAFL